jgi:phosphoribosylamine--glycine ligase|tara:strand:- start:804 stop:2072 length:1269 start_codon:yes stop_codon:yes gene_type:complete
MNIGIIGSGGREHSICFKLKQSSLVNRIYCIPGNAGTSELSENLNIDINDFEKIYREIKNKDIKLLIVGPEVPLVNGIVDYFQKKNIKVFGPNKNASRLEGSKLFMKKICKDFNIPTAKYEEITSENQAKKIINNFNFPIVVKSDGLAAGKGVTICKNKKEAIKDILEILNGKFKSSKKVIIEEFLKGEEASYFIISDGKNYLPIGTAQDHKRIGENDTGLNTGGMGAYSPSKIISKDIEKKILKKIIAPTIKAMESIGSPYKGILYAGLMIDKSEPKLIEYNIRLGDPECQVLMMRLKNDLLDLILSTFNNSLRKKKISWIKKPGITIVAASKGYPGKFDTLKEIKNLKNIKVDKSQQLFHAGTIKSKGGKILSYGGRVLNSTVIDSNLLKARKKALKILDKIKWKNKYYRRDIGFRVIKK